MFYTYLWLREDGTPYYVGKCTRKSRAYRVSCPKDHSRVILQNHESEQDALDVEVFLISFYGRKDLGTGCLRNRTDGGEGMSGFVISLETREKMRIAKLGKIGTRLGTYQSEETRRKIAKSLRGKHPPRIVVEKQIRSMMLIRQTSGYRSKMRLAAMKRWHGEKSCVL